MKAIAAIRTMRAIFFAGQNEVRLCAVISDDDRLTINLKGAPVAVQQRLIPNSYT